MKKALVQNKKMLVFFLLVVPLGIHALYKFSLGPEFAEGAFNAGDLLGFYGEVLGGFVTLLVLWFTTDETRKIQQKTEQQLEDERQERNREQRRIFVNSVIEDVSKVLANLSHCKDSRLKIKECEKRIGKYEKDLAQIRFQLAQSRKNSSNPTAQAAIPVQEMSEKELEQAIQAERNNATAYYVTKEPSIERISVLNIKLSGIQEAENLVEKIIQIMDMEDNDEISFEDFVKEMNKTMQVTADFAEKYING